MKVVILNGSREGEDSLHNVKQTIVAELTGRQWVAEVFLLREMKIHHCVGDFACWVQTPGVCLIDDAARDVARAVIQSDLTVFLTPITFGGYSSELKKVLDRIICLVSPHFMKIKGEVHHQPRYERYPHLMAVGLLHQADEESEGIFRTLVTRNALNLHAPAHIAGVLLYGEEREAVRKKVMALLAAVESVQ
jgi:multimeric flavodoxin WrbA